MSKKNSAKPIVIEQHPETDFAMCQTVGLSDGITAKVGPRKSDESSIDVQSLSFSAHLFDADAAEDWAEEHDFVTAARRLYKRTTIQAEGRKYFNCDRAEAVRCEEEDMPAPEAKDDSDSWQRVTNLVVNALIERGWYIWSDGDWDFEPKAFYSDAVVCVDVNSGEYYMIPYTVAEDHCTLGDPVKTDVTYSPSDAPNSGASSVAADVKPDTDASTAKKDIPPARSETAKMKLKNFYRTPQLIRASEGKKRSIFRILACHSGWSRDGRYFEKQALTDAVERGVFDGVQCFYKHPDESTGERPGVACGVVLPGRTTWQDNKAGGVDVFVDVMMANTTTGEDIEELLLLSLEQDVPMVGTSVFGRAQQERNQMREGRMAEVVYTKFHQLYALDFVDRAALARTGAVDLLAANSTDTHKSDKGVKPTMSITPEQLAAAEKRAKDAEDLAAKEKDRADKAERAVDVDTMMASCPLPAVLQKPIRAQLLLEPDKDKRQASYDTSCAIYAAALPATKAGNPGSGSPNATEDPDLDVQSQELADNIVAVAASHGLSKDDLIAAQERRKGNPVPVKTAAKKGETATA